MRSHLLKQHWYRRLEVTMLTGICRLIYRSESFRYKDTRLPYFIHPYNATYANERMVEIPIIEYELRQLGKHPTVLEIGNVLSHYRHVWHDVCDKNPAEDANIRCDIQTIPSKVKYDCIISISTIEHIGFDEGPFGEKDPGKILKVITQLKKHCDTLIWTFTLGFNKSLDADWRAGTYSEFVCTVYTRFGLIWLQTTHPKDGDLIVLQWKEEQ